MKVMKLIQRMNIIKKICLHFKFSKIACERFVESIFFVTLQVTIIDRRPLRKGNIYIEHFPERGSALLFSPDRTKTRENVRFKHASVPEPSKNPGKRSLRERRRHEGAQNPGKTWRMGTLAS